MKFLYDLADDFLSILFPRLCNGCGNHLLRNEKLICTECFIEIPRTGYHLVEDNPVASLFWGRCLIQRAAAFSYYNRGSRIRRIIHNLKYKGIRDVGREIGIIYGSELDGSQFCSGIDIILPVPLHHSKMRKRGFNQSELICSGISDATGIRMDSSSLVRCRSTSTQTRRTRYDRWTNVEGVFRINDPDQLRGKHVLLVDDVITTGSTIESCANELLKIEGVKVSVAAIAYAVI
jgi:ComF family protein